MSFVAASRRFWLPLVVLMVVAITVLLVWRQTFPTTATLRVINMGEEVVELELYGAGLVRSISAGPLAPQQQSVLSLELRSEGEMRLRAISSRASVDTLLLPQATQLRDEPMQLEVRDGTRFVLMSSH